MRPEDQRELLRKWSEAKGPSDLVRERAWKAISSRVAAGDPGPELPSSSLSALKITAITASVLAVVGVGAWGVRTVLTRDRSSTQDSSASSRKPGSRSPLINPPSGDEAAAAGATCRGLDRPYTDPAQADLASSNAAMAQPWRAYLDTLPATSFVEGVGVFVKLDDLRNVDADALVALLARHGVRTLQFELHWDNMTYDTETFDTSGGRRASALLSACRRYGVRPTIRVLSHDTAPCPERRGKRRLAAGAVAGDRTLTFTDTSDLFVGRSGLTKVGHDQAAGILFTELRGQTVTLSKPLPFDLPAGASVQVSTLKYRPFAAPDTPEFAETLAGWKHYLTEVANLATRALGTSEAPDKGFDLELWNSVGFFSQFLFAGRYYDPPRPDDDRAWRRVVEETGRLVATDRQRFGGVRMINSFPVDDTGDSCPKLPVGFAGVRRSTPGALARPLLQDADGRVSDPFLWPWPGGGGRSLRIAFPEVEATALVPTSFIGQLRNSCSVWISGGGVDTSVVSPDATPERARALEAKVSLRQYSFFLGKGARRVTVGAAITPAQPDGRGLGLVRPADGAGTPAVVSPALGALARLVAITGEGADPGLARPRRLEITDVADCHDHVQFRGPQGTLYNRDVFVALPFQANDARFVIHYYVMTRHTAADLAPERYTVTLKGIDASRAHVRAFDPLTNREVPATAEPGEGESLRITLEAVDYPRVLVVEE